MKLKTLRKSEIKSLNEELFKHFGSRPLNKKDNIQKIDDNYIRVNNKLLYFFHEGEIVPTLKNTSVLLKTIVVDMGAVKFMCNGADLMRPGIVSIDKEILIGDYVIIVDVNNNKALMIGVSLSDAKDMEAQKNGKCVTSLHYVGDEIWNMK